MVEKTSINIKPEVLDVWREVLDIDEAPLDHSFLKLGGNSLLATMLANWLEENVGIRPTMQEVFKLTLRKLADLCASRNAV